MLSYKKTMQTVFLLKEKLKRCPQRHIDTDVAAR